MTAHGLTGSHARDADSAVLERRLARLRYDLHDGPQQDIHLLAQDLALFREQLAPMIEGHPDRDRAIGRLDDLAAQLQALDADLRRLATSVRSPLASSSLRAALSELVAAFAARSEIVPTVALEGDVDALSDSQRIALLSVIREALSNVRRHSAARTVQIELAADGEGICARVRDDGEGFDADAEPERAARAGRLGLVGMRERIVMLGGHAEIDSRPGKGTIVSATLPRWSSDG